MHCSRRYPCAYCLSERLYVKYRDLVPVELQRQVQLSFGRRLASHVAAWQQIHNPGHNEHVLMWAAYGIHPVAYDFLDQLGLPRFRFVRALRTIALQAAAWWFDGDAVVFSQRPVHLVRNEQGQLSNNAGPAVAYADGVTYYAWRDQQVQEHLMPAAVDLSAAKHGQHGLVALILSGGAGTSSASILIDMYGPERFLREVPHNQKLRLDQSKWGTLWQVLGYYGRDTRLFVEVKNSSGLGEKHVIPVHPHLVPLGHPNPRAQSKTALNAIASTFGMTGEQYKEIVEA